MSHGILSDVVTNDFRSSNTTPNIFQIGIRPLERDQIIRPCSDVPKSIQMPPEDLRQHVTLLMLQSMGYGRGL